MKDLEFSAPLGMGLGASFLAAGLAGAATTLSINQASGPTGVIVESTLTTSFTRAFHNNATVGKSTRGNTFTMPDTGDANTGYSVTGLTLRKSVQQTFAAGDTLQLWVFAWNPAGNANTTTNWTAGDGMDPINGGDSDPLDGTGCTLLLAETFGLNGLTFNDQAFFTFDLSASPLTLAENTAYGFLIGYIDGQNTTTESFEYEQSASNSYAGGTLIRTQGKPSANDTQNLDLTFYVTGAAVPEPSAAALLLMSGAGLMIRRRRR